MVVGGGGGGGGGTPKAASVAKALPTDCSGSWAVSLVAWSISGSMSGCDKFGCPDSWSSFSAGTAADDIAFGGRLLHYIDRQNGESCNDRPR